MSASIKKPHICKSCLGDDGFELRRRVLANRSEQIVFQCLTCGRSATNPIARCLVSKPNDLPEWDEGLSEQFDGQKHQQHLQQKTEWFREHNAYLKSDKWRMKRRKVLERCHGICEGCMDAPVEHVHHLNYNHWQDELLFELVGLCEPCHERAHGRSLSAQGAS